MDGALPGRAREAQPFGSAAAAWFWCAGMLQGRQQGAGAAFGAGARVCEPDDIVMALDRLYRQRKITLEHARILRIYGERGSAPNASYPPERSHHRLWQEAIRALDFPLRNRGIVR